MAASSSFFSILLIAVTALFAVLVQQNPLLFGRRKVDVAAESTTTAFTIYTHHPVLEHHLQAFRSVLGGGDDEDDYLAYRNHCLRVLTFAAYHCGDACGKRDVDLMAMALAYHDVALWTDQKLDYLEPSVRQMEAHANDDDSTASESSWTAQEMATAREIILQHHKLTDWRNTNSNDSDALVADAKLVNAVRKGDWADATMGLVRFDGLPAALLETAYARVPDAGFHRLLLQMGPRLSPDSLLGRLDLLKILKW